MKFFRPLIITLIILVAIFGLLNFNQLAFSIIPGLFLRLPVERLAYHSAVQIAKELQISIQEYHFANYQKLAEEMGQKVNLGKMENYIQCFRNSLKETGQLPDLAAKPQPDEFTRITCLYLLYVPQDDFIGLSFLKDLTRGEKIHLVAQQLLDDSLKGENFDESDILKGALKVRDFPDQTSLFDIAWRLGSERKTWLYSSISGIAFLKDLDRLAGHFDCRNFDWNLVIATSAFEQLKPIQQIVWKVFISLGFLSAITVTYWLQVIAKRLSDVHQIAVFLKKRRFFFLRNILLVVFSRSPEQTLEKIISRFQNHWDRYRQEQEKLERIEAEKEAQRKRKLELLRLIAELEAEVDILPDHLQPTVKSLLSQARDLGRKFSERKQAYDQAEQIVERFKKEQEQKQNEFTELAGIEVELWNLLDQGQVPTELEEQFKEFLESAEGAKRLAWKKYYLQQARQLITAQKQKEGDAVAVPQGWQKEPTIIATATFNLWQELNQIEKYLPTEISLVTTKAILWVLLVKFYFKNKYRSVITTQSLVASKIGHDFSKQGFESAFSWLRNQGVLLQEKSYKTEEMASLNPHVKQASSEQGEEIVRILIVLGRRLKNN